MSGRNCAGAASAQIRHLPTRAGSRRVLYGPVGNIDAGAAGIEQFDEVILQRGAAVSTATIYLADDHTR